MSTWTLPASSPGWWTRWKTSTTCRTSTRMWTSRTKSSPRWRRKTNCMALRVLGIDPGLTRCGFGVVDVEANRRASLVGVGVVGTHSEEPLDQRLLALFPGTDE